MRVLTVALLAACAYFQARALTQLLGHALIASEPAPTVRPAPRVAPALRTPKSAAPILERNPFDSSRVPLREQPVLATIAEAAPVVSSLEDVLGAPECDGFTVNIVTQSSDPHASVAQVRGVGETAFSTRRVGERIAEKTVVYIGMNPAKRTPAVWLLENDKLCQALLFTPEKTGAPQRIEHRNPG